MLHRLERTIPAGLVLLIAIAVVDGTARGSSSSLGDIR
jgi:hypothetical protein